MTYFIYNEFHMIVAAYDDIGVMLFDYINYLKQGMRYQYGHCTDVPEIFWSPTTVVR